MTIDFNSTINSAQLSAELRQKLAKKYQDIGVAEELRKQFTTAVGDNVETRWTIDSPDFKPLKDILGHLNTPFEQEMYKFLSDPDIQHFVLSPEMSLEVHKLNDLSRTDPEAFKKLMPKAKLPYQRCCVEIPLTAEVQTMLRDTKDGEGVIRRLGAYIEMRHHSDDVITYEIFTYHEFEYGSVQASLVAYINKHDEPIDDLYPIKFEGLDTVWNAAMCPILRKAYPKFKYHELWDLFGGQEAFSLSILDTVHDIGVLFFSWLFLINSKSGVVTKKVPPILSGSGLGRRQRLRRNRSGYTIIALDDIEYIGSDNVVHKKDIVAAHRVRGHFKQKKHGIYWWRPHIRGGGDLIEREGYKII